jgi:GntR family transcriptional repressor for pyruvate dehydrogenase complex
MVLEKINLSDEAFKQILAVIASRGYEPGTKIPSENELVISLGVSRNTVRTALNRLNALGILEVRHGEGYFIKDIDVDVFSNLQLPILLEEYSNLETFTEFRIGIESQGSALAAVKADDDDMQNMREALELSWKYLADLDRFAVYDMDFHLAIAKASKNGMIYRSVEMVKTLYTVWLRNFIRAHGNSTSNMFHTKLFESIKNRDAEAARRFMMEHLTDVLYKVQSDATKKVVRLFSDDPDSADATGR